MSPQPLIDHPGELPWHWPYQQAPATMGRRSVTPGIGPSQEAANDRAATPWHPDSPVFWGALIVAATALGLVAVEGGIRVGPAKASVRAGKEA